MKLIVDSVPVDLPAPPAATFADYCRDLMHWLLPRQRAIGRFLIDGRPVTTVAEAEADFVGARICEIETLPLGDALRLSLTHQVETLRTIEAICESLVTDALLAEPGEVAVRWQELCTALREQLERLPQVAGLLTDDEIDAFAQDRLGELSTLMRDIAAALNRADVVGFSDILELRLLPWLRCLSGFLHDRIRTIPEPPGSEAAAA